MGLNEPFLPYASGQTCYGAKYENVFEKLLLLWILSYFYFQKINGDKNKKQPRHGIAFMYLIQAIYLSFNDLNFSSFSHIKLQ